MEELNEEKCRQALEREYQNNNTSLGLNGLSTALYVLFNSGISQLAHSIDFAVSDVIYLCFHRGPFQVIINFRTSRVNSFHNISKKFTLVNGGFHPISMTVPCPSYCCQ